MASEDSPGQVSSVQAVILNILPGEQGRTGMRLSLLTCSEITATGMGRTKSLEGLLAMVTREILEIVFSKYNFSSCR